MFDTTQPAYVDFRNIIAERTRSVVAWVGAGLSQQGGLPGWADLRLMLTAEADQRIHSLNPSDSSIPVLRGKLKAAKEQANPWIAFEILRDILGPTSYRAAIRRMLQPADTCAIPSGYSRLWSLRLTGMISLNLDRLAARAWSSVNPGKFIAEFAGQRADQNTHILRSGSPFIANFHGISTEEASWVFTQDALSVLLEDEGYQNFVRTVASTKTILFIGISADDIAAGGHLERLRAMNIDFGSHFWITHRNDFKTFDWAERAGIQLITYDPHDGHVELERFFNDLSSFIPTDPPATPVVMPIAEGSAPLPPPHELASQPAEVIRRVLNAHASHLLAHHPERWDAFYAEYDEAIYRAWYVGPRPAGQKILGYTLDGEISKGAFGRVFKAKSESGETVALKLLHEDVRHSKEKLDAFRRGVRSMQILSEHKVKGMVPYRAASEIPAFAIMDLINGPNLAEAVEAGLVDSWSEILRIANELAIVIRRAHSLPERVLHRDIRPPNVMLKDYYSASDGAWQLVVLDFDLSWHRDALGQSVVAETLHGYLAPEQVSDKKESSTRNALVDSFGLGMTLYFLATTRDPLFAQHRHSDWEQKLVADVASRAIPHQWKSLPRRFARLIAQCTQDSQADRLDMARIQGELQRLREAEFDSRRVESAELIAEEVLARAKISEYGWNPDLLEAVSVLPSGLEIHVAADEVEQEVSIRFTWRGTGLQERKRVIKWLPDAGQRAHAKLRKAGWNPDLSIESLGLTINGALSVRTIRTNLDGLAAAVGEAAEELRFD